MNNLIINNISIISYNSKIAKFCEFDKGINVVTSNKESKGNYVGKSSLLRSIFHTLGADGKYSSEWEKEGKYVYILDFNYNDVQYYMLRNDILFKLYDQNYKQIFKVINREDLAIELCKLFNQEIYLQTHQGHYALAHPVYNYLLNYIEQKEIKCCEFQSFYNLTSYKSYYNDLLYSHLGLNNSEYNNLKIKNDEYLKILKDLNDKKVIFQNMINELKLKPNMSLSIDEIDVLKTELSNHQEKYNELIVISNSHKKKLYDAYNFKKEVELIINDLKKNLKLEDKETNKILKDHSCPLCNSHLEDEKKVYFKKVNDIENYQYQLLDAEKELGKIEREINLLLEKYEKSLNEIKDIEFKVFDHNSKTTVEDKLISMGVSKIKSNLYNELTKNEKSITEYTNKRKSIQKEITKLNKKKEKINRKYCEYLSDIILKYNLDGFSMNKIKGIEDKIKVDGTKINITTVAWLCSLLAVKYENNKDSTVYPLIFDNPNNADFDDENETKIFSLIFDNLPINGQIITSRVGFDKSKFDDYDIAKVITLNNPQNSLLNKDDFGICINKYRRILND